MNKKIILMLIIWMGFLTSQQIEAKQTPSVWLEIKNATKFEEEFIRLNLAWKARGIVHFKRDDNFGYDKGISFDGGIRINFVDDESNLFIESTRKTQSYNIDLEKIEIQSIKINRATLRRFQEINRYYAFINSITHGVICHAATQSLDHTTWGLCRPDLSTNKEFWGKKHRKRLRRNLDLPGRTGQFLML